ncbi:RNA-directed DNA polymerase, eukaryota [Tanacetum coccineum]
MGDFNEVRIQEERFGSIFNSNGAAIFNHFISSSDLVEVPIGGCTFTWVHKSKMSKLDCFLISNGLMQSCPNISAPTLDRYLPDHRPILLREISFDYGPTPFRFSLLVRDRRKVDESELQIEKQPGRHYKIIDTGKATSNLLNKRMNVMNSLHDMERLDLWRNNLAIRGILVDGVWIDSPSMVKNEFLSHFANIFDRPSSSRLLLDMNFPNQLSSDAQADLENNEILDFLENDVMDAVSYFFQNSSFPINGNSSFIALIPKSQNANMVKDFRPISLIGSLNKIISKILANLLVIVLGDNVSDVQSAFVTGRQILDGPFILNDLIQWCKSKKKQTMIFKVDFENAFDSIWWDYLDDVL